MNQSYKCLRFYISTFISIIQSYLTLRIPTVIELNTDSQVFNVLIVDDEPDIHAAIKMSIKHEVVFGRPLNIHSAYSKKEAIEFVEQFNDEISLVFLDVVMETEHAGFEFLTELRNSNQHPQPQVALITGQAGLTSERDAAKKHEINAYLSKTDLNPYRLVSLLNTSIRNFITIEKLEETSEKLQLAQAQQAESNAYTSSILNSISDALVVVNHLGIIETVNAAVTSMFGYSSNELIGHNVEMLMPEPYASRHNQYLHTHHTTGTYNIIGKGRELPAKKKNGQTFPMELTLTEFNNHGESLYIGLIRNISERIEAQKEIYHLAYFDHVTNLPNMTNFYKSLSKRTNTALEHELVALALVDISGFYRINQAYGHDVGDQLLTLIVDRLEWVLPKHCNLYRSEGTNFLIQLNNASQDKKTLQNEFEHIANQLLEAIGQDIVLGTSSHQISANIGIFIRQVTEVNESKVLHQLEFSTLQAKKKSNINISIYDSKAEQQDTNKYLLEQELSKAIERNEFEIYLQPQFSIHKKLVCSEALIRWNSKNLGFVSPDQFINIAENSGLIVPIGRWVLEQVCLTIADTRAKGHKTNIAINVSTRELLQPDFVSAVIACINKYRIPARALTIEITESVFATDIETVITNMSTLSDLGVRFSIDDFGTGYSSLSYLKRLPIKELKIDKSFIDDITDTETSVPLVDAIITMADSLSLEIVAEGVEHNAQFDYLRNKHAVITQGYLFSKPLPLTDWYKFIDQ